MRDITYTMVHIKELIELDYWNNILRFSSKEDKIQNFESEQVFRIKRKQKKKGTKYEQSLFESKYSVY